MDQIQAMRIFVRVVEAGTFTRAADSLALPKGTVTKQIQALESRLRVKLLNRTTRRVTVTPDGAAYFERAARLLNDFDDMEASMVSYFSGTTRRIYPHEFKKGDEQIELNGPYRVSVNESNAHIAAVLGGFGISQCITFMAEPLLESGELVEVLPDWSRDPLPIHVVYPPNRHLSAKVRAFVDWAAELFAKNPRLQRR